MKILFNTLYSFASICGTCQTPENPNIDEVSEILESPYPLAHSLEDYVGTYEHPDYGIVQIQLDKGRLVAFYEQFLFELDHEGDNFFNGIPQELFFDELSATFSFFNDPNGEISEVHIPFGTHISTLVFKKNELFSPMYLKQFEGVFEGYAISAKIEFTENRLTLKVPGQPIYDLIPEKPFHFSIKGLDEFLVQFIPDSAGKIIEASLQHSYGVFNFKAK